MALPSITLTALGWRAQAALAETAGLARVLARLSTSIYLTAGDEILWLGRGGAIHPRAMLTADPLRVQGETLALDPGGLRPWRPRACAPADASALTVSAQAVLATLRTRRECVPAPLGLAPLLVGNVPPFPLDRAVAAVRAVARACDADAARAALAAADPLLGLGPGLTPSGDDFVGGVLFARHAAGDLAWRETAAALVARARARTNPISQAFLADLAAGRGHEPLHTLSDALARGFVGEGALGAIRRLAALGHSSGWDMLTGFLVGLAGSAALAPTVAPPGIDRLQ